MLRITNITNQAMQDFNIALEDRTTLRLKLRYLPTQFMWVGTATYESKVTDFALLQNVNLLHNWKNFITFGLMCVTLDEADPFLLSDFAPTAQRDARCQLYILNVTEIEEFNTIAYGGQI